MNKQLSSQLAIVGMSCRFPGGAHSPEAFWSLMAEGRDAVTNIDKQRWNQDLYFHPRPGEAGRAYTFSAGVIDDIYDFDADFFGISRREAVQIDPQQRLMLELIWETLEDAGCQPESLAGTDCGVYVGMSSRDYGDMHLGDEASFDAYTMLGTAISIAANRASYIFDFTGPSLVIDTACSSSLVAFHNACAAIHAGEASSAIVGSVHLLLSPTAFVGFSQAGMLSPDGRCKAFGAKGNGYVRSEGGGAVFLKPLDAAIADGNKILAVVRNSGVNFDGRTNGIALPRQKTQQALLEKLYRDADISADEVNYIEAHGTGTAVGDPIEARAIGEAVAKNKSKPLVIGSVKTNIGHLEPASGLAGLIKAILMLNKRKIPPSLHASPLSPKIDFEGLNLRVSDRLLPLGQGKEKAIIGINSFGFGGANAHVVLESACHARTSRARRQPGRTPPLMLSAQSSEALKEQAGNHLALLKSSKSPSYYNVAYTRAFNRSHLDHRLMVTGNSRREIVDRLETFCDGEKNYSVVSGKSISRNARVALVFSGNASQWQGMGCKLFEADPVFRGAVKRVDKQFRRLAKWSVIDELFADESRMELTEVAQPTLFALQVGVVQTLEKQGMVYDAVIGHSVGEVAAAYASGSLSLEKSIRVIYERSRAQEDTRGLGRMAAAALTVEQAQEEVAASDGKLEIAAINSARSVTMSGPLEELEALKDRLEVREVFCYILDLDYAFHSKVMDPIREPLLRSLRNLRPKRPQIRFQSSVTGKEIKNEKELGADYWWQNIRQPVLFGEAIGSLIDDGFGVFLEIGPHPILQVYTREMFDARSANCRMLGTLSRIEDDVARLGKVLQELYVNGAEMDMSRMFPAKGECIDLPKYPWQRIHYVYEKTPEATGNMFEQREHALLGDRLADGEWENFLDVRTNGFLADHVVGGSIVFPAAGFVEMALAASRHIYGGDSHRIENLEIYHPLVLAENGAKCVRFTVTPDDNSFKISSRDRLSEDSWVVNVVGRLVSEIPRPPAAPIDVPALKGAADVVFSRDEHYQRAEVLGLQYGKAFRCVKKVWLLNDHEALATLKLPSAAAFGGSGDGVILHPSLLDGAFQTLFDILHRQIFDGDHAAYVPSHIGQLVQHRVDGIPSYCLVKLIKISVRSLVANFQLFDGKMRCIAELGDCRFRQVNIARSAKSELALYDFQLIPMQRTDVERSSPIIRSNQLAAAVKMRLEMGKPRWDWSHHVSVFTPLVGAFVSSSAYELVCALSKLLSKAWGAFTIVELMDANDISEDQRPFLTYLLTVMEQDGHALRHGDQWRLNKNETPISSLDIWRSVVADHPRYVAEITLAGRVGKHLKGIVCGEVSPSIILEPKTNSGTLDHLYDSSPSFRPVNFSIREAIGEIVAHWPNSQRLRILEISNARGLLASSIADKLPSERCDYVIASGNEHTTEGANALASSHSFISVVEFEADKNLTDLEVESNRFDLVIVTNVMAEFDHIEQSLNMIQRVLRKDGILMMSDHYPDRLTDFIYGIRKQWWSRSVNVDEPTSRLLLVDEWRELFLAQGFIDIIDATEDLNSEIIAPFLLICRNTAFSVDRDTADDVLVQIEPARDESAPPTEEFVSRRDDVWLVLRDGDGFSSHFTEFLENELALDGRPVVHAIPGDAYEQENENHPYAVRPVEAEDFSRLLQDVTRDHGGIHGIVHLMGLTPDAETQQPDLVALQELRCSTALHMSNAVLRRKWPDKVDVWLVTAGAMGMANEAGGTDAVGLSPAQSTLWGFGRVMMNECPYIACRMVDLHFADDEANLAQALSLEMKAPEREDEIVLVGDDRYVVRFRRASMSMVRSIKRQRKLLPANGSGATSIRLDFDSPGPLTHLKWGAVERKKPGSGEIEVKPVASGMNFRDVMWAMGLLADESVEDGFAGPTLGLECAGEVVDKGPDVDDFEIGDHVLCFAPSCFSTYLTTKVTAAAHIPPGIAFEEAATIPSTFFTAYYALHHLAQLQPGERILIHGGAGGVGLAAIQYAAFRGAEIFTSAGSDEKRDFLSLLGVDHIFDSRSMNFADDILRATNGEGVDIVLNSLSGEAITRNLSILKPFGRFLELGKRDYYANTKIGLRPFRNNISYFGIDADQLLVARPEVARRLFQELIDLFHQGELRPLVHRVFQQNQVQDAFRYMQQSKHIGKIIVSFERAPVLEAGVLEDRTSESLELRDDRSYLITGGLGGFGLATAKWLVEKGARHVVLVGRSGDKKPEAKQQVEELRELGVEVHVFAADITDRDALKAVIDATGNDIPPLAGVIHAAMVLDDTIIRNMTTPRLFAVMLPKIQGAWVLHELTLDQDLDFFVCYSSATTYLGNPGQANYIAANSYLETLAQYRTQLGLPALTVSWGPIEDVGYLTKNEAVLETLRSKLGRDGLTSAAALEMLESLLVEGAVTCAVFDMDWRAVKKSLPIARAPKYEGFSSRISSDSGVEDDILDLLADMPREEALTFIAGLLAEHLEEILRIPADKIDPHRPLYDMGLDSLMSMELIMGIEERFGVELSMFSMTQDTTITKIAIRLAETLLQESLSQEGLSPATAQQHSLVTTLSEVHDQGATPEQIMQVVSETNELLNRKNRTN